MSRHTDNIPGADHPSPDEGRFCPHNIVSRVRDAARRQEAACAAWKKNHPRNPAVSFRYKPSRSRMWPLDLSVVHTHVSSQIQETVIEQQMPSPPGLSRRKSDASHPFYDVRAHHDLTMIQSIQYHREWSAANARAAARQHAQASINDVEVAKQWAQCDVPTQAQAAANRSTLESPPTSMRRASNDITPQPQPAYCDATRKASIQHQSALQVDIMCDFQRRESMHNLPPRHVRPRLRIQLCAERDVNVNYFVYDKEPYANSSICNDPVYVVKNSAGTELPSPSHPPKTVVHALDSPEKSCQSPELMYPSPPIETRKRKSRDESVGPGDRSAKRTRTSLQYNSRTPSKL